MRYMYTCDFLDIRSNEPSFSSVALNPASAPSSEHSDLNVDTMPNSSSAAGISALHARQFVNFAGMDTKPAYLHICEGATQLHDGRKDETTGKLISYLVSDFIKANSYGKSS